MVTEPTRRTRPLLDGLDDSDVARRIEAGAVNTQPDGPSRTVAEIVRANVFTLFNMLLGALLVIILIVAPVQDALFGVVLVANALIGIIQELRAKRTLDSLALLNAPRATVVRNGGRAFEIPVDQVVLDDLLQLKAGDQIVVDGVVVRSDSLEVNESLLTGESDPILKEVGAEVLSGSFVSSGSGVFKARRVGTDAYATKLAAEARKFTLVRSELRRGIDWILRGIAWVMVPTMVLLVWSQLDANAEVFEAIRVSVAGMVAMIPQGLVLLTSVAFAVGVVRLGKRNVLVQELPAVEGLARVDVICFDKTGTLTEGRLAVETMQMLTERDDAKRALGALAASDPNPNATLQAVAEAFRAPSGWWPTETVPFSSARKWSAATFGTMGSWVIGAPEMIMPNDPGVTGAVAEGAAEGRRMLLLAHSPEPPAGDRLPKSLQAVAVLGLSDRIRSDAAATLRYFAEQGVEAKVISGDHPETVASIARAVGLAGADNTVDARNLPTDDSDMIRVIEEGTVFGRVTPHQKRAMVGALQARGKVVAMTGDGVNDVLALKDADIGIAMGSGSSASRSVAQLVLMDGEFDTLPSVVNEGRRVISNIERVANLFVTKTVYAFLLAVLVGAFSRPFPFVPRHLTLVGTLTIGAPAFVLALAPTANRARPGFVKRVLRFALPVGAVAAAATYGAYEMAIDELGAEGPGLTEARTLATLVLVSVGLFALVMNSRPLTQAKRAIIAAMGATFAIVLASESLRTFFELDMPRYVVTMAGLGIIGITGALLYASLRSAGWFRDMPDLIRSAPREVTKGLGGLRTIYGRLRHRARSVVQPLDDGPPET